MLRLCANGLARTQTISRAFTSVWLTVFCDPIKLLTSQLFDNSLQACGALLCQPVHLLLLI
jgi:hypothetical protein